MRGKYSPTVTAAYMADQDWHDRFCESVVTTENWVEFDPDGFDKYGYNADGIDRDGNHEDIYAESDEYGFNYWYDTVIDTWDYDGVRPVLKMCQTNPV